jgi:hypothetical protein
MEGVETCKTPLSLSNYGGKRMNMLTEAINKPVKMPFKRKCKHCKKYNTYNLPVLKVDKEAIVKLLGSLANWCDEIGGELIND